MVQPEQPKLDNSIEAMTNRLQVLQSSLGALMNKALALFDDAFPTAPHPAQAPDSPVYSTSSLNICPSENIPMNRELTVVLAARRWIAVSRNTDSSSNAYPRQHLLYRRPECKNQRQIKVMRTHNPERLDILYDIETMDYDQRGNCIDSVGYAYFGQEPFIVETEIALDEARKIANDVLGLTDQNTSGRIRAQRAIISSELFWGIGIGALENWIPEA